MRFYRSHVLVCVDPPCLKKGAHQVVTALQDELSQQGLIVEFASKYVTLMQSKSNDCNFTIME